MAKRLGLGALRPHDIEALLASDQRGEALAYLAACTRLRTLLEPFCAYIKDGPDSAYWRELGKILNKITRLAK